MAGAIKLFLFHQKFNQMAGIFLTKSDQKSANAIRNIFVICPALNALAVAIFMVYEANSIFDYGYSFFMFISLTQCIILYLTFVWQSENILEFIQSCERFIEKSKNFKLLLKMDFCFSRFPKGRPF